MRAPAIRGAGLAARAARVCDARAARERRRLPIHRAARRLQFLFQLLVLPPQALPLGFRPAQVLAQPLDVAPLLVDDLLRRGARLVALRHAPVMPNPRSKYKRKLRVSAH